MRGCRRLSDDGIVFGIVGIVGSKFARLVDNGMEERASVKGKGDVILESSLEGIQFTYRTSEIVSIDFRVMVWDSRAF